MNRQEQQIVVTLGFSDLAGTRSGKIKRPDVPVLPKEARLISENPVENSGLPRRIEENLRRESAQYEVFQHEKRRWRFQGGMLVRYIEYGCDGYPARFWEAAE